MESTLLVSVVEDDQSVRESLQGLLRSLGLTVQVFATAEEFMCSEQLNATVCLILDVRMPGKSGPDLQRWLAANHHEMQIVFITAHDEDEKTRERCLRDGAVAYLVKPVGAKTLRDVVHKALGVQ
jgi:FixJ family two-component response regulator